MKYCFRACILLLLVVTSYGVNGQYITLKGKQFYDQSGEPFYPVICNYEIRLTCDDCSYVTTGGYCNNCPLSNFELHPIFKYGSTVAFNEAFTEGVDKIKADFEKMLDMGFNTVRILWFTFMMMDHHRAEKNAGIVPFIKEPWGQFYMPGGGGKIICESFANPRVSHLQGSGEIWYGHPLKAGPPYHTEPPFDGSDNLHRIFFPKMHELLDIASGVGIHVILVTGGNFVSNSMGLDVDGLGKIVPYPNAAAEQAAEYAEFLAEYALNLKDRSEILAYDLFNEPVWWTPRSGYSNTAENKTDICNYTEMWYNAMKAKDPNHLITLSNSDVGDVFAYDPAITKLDFYSPHIYPNWYWRAYENYDRALAMERLNTQLYWINNNCPIPWAVTETGFNNCNQVNCNAPNFWGNTAQQTQAAIESQQAVMNYNGSGYGWWEFQDKVGSPDPIGLLITGNPPQSTAPFSYNEALEKPMVNDAFTDNVITAKSAPASQPASYYNMYGGQFFTFSGIVRDQNGNPIKDAVVVGQNDYIHAFKSILPQNQNPNISTNKLLDGVKFSITTFTDSDGAFSLIAPIQSLGLLPGDYDYGKFDHIIISAPGASVYEWYSGVPNTSQSGAPPLGNIELERITGVYDNSISNITIHNTESEIYQARRKLTTEDVTVEDGGAGDFHAGLEVELKPGFEAEQGSEVYIHCANAGPYCNLSPSYKTDESHRSLKAASTTRREILVSYAANEQNTLQLMPNPAYGYVYVVMSQSYGSYEVYNTSGKRVTFGELSATGRTRIDVTGLAPGIYTVRAGNSTFTASKTIVIQQK
ncbi:MAG: cellulase family glycosylhydrolase [Chitinophagales bacterium]|nr:cellulase family glycosylhydrolase [Chitinophagales bacterium]